MKIDREKLLKWLNEEYYKMKPTSYDQYTSGKQDMLDIIEQKVESGAFDTEEE